MTSQPKEHNVVHEISQYQRRIKVENSAPADWESDWGFLRSEESRSKEKELELFKTHADEVLPLGMPDEDTAPFVERVRIWRNKAPKSKFMRPILTSHEIGWRPPIDLIGPNQFGVQRNPELFPAAPAVRKS